MEISNAKLKKIKNKNNNTLSLYYQEYKNE